MSGRRITELAVATGVAPTDLIPIVDMAGTPTTKQATARLLIDGVAALREPNERTADYTLTVGDANAAVEMNLAGANTLTVPTNAAVGFLVGTTILVTQTGAGTTTLAGSGGVTLNAVGGLALPGQWATALLRKTDADVWVVTILDAAGGSGVVEANVQTASYTLALSDAGKAVEMDVAGANDLTVPPNSSVALPVGTVIEVAQVGAGQTTVVAGSGVTVRTPETLVLSGQWSTVSLRKRGTDDWLLAGDVEAAP